MSFQGLQFLELLTITVSAPGFMNATIVVTSYPSGFVFASSNFTTYTFAATNSVTAQAVLFNPTLFTVIGNALLGPAGPTTWVATNSATPGVGTVSTPTTFRYPGDVTDSATFTPISNGATLLTLGTPAGFTTGSQTANYLGSPPPSPLPPSIPAELRDDHRRHPRRFQTTSTSPRSRRYPKTSH